MTPNQNALCVGFNLALSRRSELFALPRFPPSLRRLPNESTLFGKEKKKRNRAADENYTTPELR